MPGHGSPPPSDQAFNESRQVHRDSGMRTEEHDTGFIREYRPPLGATSKVSDRGTRFMYQVGDSLQGGRGGSVRTLQRARTAVRVVGQRLAEGRDRYTGL